MNALEILMSQNETIGAEQDKLQQLAAEPVQQSFRNPGQTGFDMLKNPDANQSRALLEGALAMLNSNPANPAQGFSSGISAGLNLNKQMKEEQRDQQLKAQDYKVGGAESQFDRTLGIIEAMPQPPKQKIGRKFFRNPETRDIKGLTEIDGVLFNDKEQEVTPGQLASTGYHPYSGSSAALDGDDIDKPPSAKTTRSMINMASTAVAYDRLEDMLSGNRMDDFKALLQGSVDVPLEVSRDWNAAKLVIENGVGRLESGGQIRENESKKYIKMLVPTLYDIASPKTIKRKIRNGKAAAIIFNKIQMEQLTPEQAIEELNAILLAPVDEDANAGGATATNDPLGLR